MEKHDAWSASPHFSRVLSKFPSASISQHSTLTSALFLYCIIQHDNKASENLTFILKQRVLVSLLLFHSINFSFTRSYSYHKRTLIIVATFMGPCLACNTHTAGLSIIELAGCHMAKYSINYVYFV